MNQLLQYWMLQKVLGHPHELKNVSYVLKVRFFPVIISKVDWVSRVKISNDWGLGTRADWLEGDSGIDALPYMGDFVFKDTAWKQAFWPPLCLRQPSISQTLVLCDSTFAIYTLGTIYIRQLTYKPAWLLQCIFINMIAPGMITNQDVYKEMTRNAWLKCRKGLNGYWPNTGKV